MSEHDPFDYEDEDEVVDLDPTNKAPSRKLERFKGEQGRTYRVAVLFFHDLERSLISRAKRKARKDKTELDKDAVKATIKKALAKRAEDLGKSVDELQAHEKLDLKTAQFKKHNTQYLKAEGGGLFISRKGKDGPEADKYWNQLEDDRTYYWTIALIYPTDRDGNVEAKAVMREAVLKPWRFSDGMFNTLIEKNAMLKSFGESSSLANCDLKLKCKNSQYQNFDVDPAGEALWVKVPKIRDKFLPEAVAMYDRMVDAREISTADLKEKLGASGGDSGADVVDDDELDGIIDDI